MCVSLCCRCLAPPVRHTQGPKQPSKGAARAAAAADRGAAVAKACATNAPLPASPAAEPPSAHAQKRAKPYAPRHGSANYAFLIVMYRAHRLGKSEWGKEELMAAAEASGLANKPIRNVEAAANAAKGNYAGAYDGWSCLRVRVSFNVARPSSPPARSAPQPRKHDCGAVHAHIATHVCRPWSIGRRRSCKRGAAL